jgi:hypothetical protein
MNVNRNGRTYWVGDHKTLGPVVFDGDWQGELKGGQVRLYIRDQDRMGVFVASDARAQILDHGPSPEREAAVDRYVHLLSGMRVTHCYECKATLTSAECPECGKCHKLRCRCGACMCGYTGDDNGVSKYRRLDGPPRRAAYAAADFPDPDAENDEDGFDRDLACDLGLDPNDPDFTELGAEGTDPDEIDWESEDYERN